MTRAILVLFGLAACDAGRPAQPTMDPTPSDAGSPAPSDAAAAPSAWSAPARLPFAQQETAVVALGGRVFVLGGFDAAQTVLTTVHVFDPANETWSTVAPLPRPFHHVNAVALDGKIWVAGALEGPTFTATGDTFVYDPTANTWSPRAAMPAGTQRGSSMVAAIGATIYVAGGIRSGASVADFSAYDPKTDTWSAPLPALPAPRDHGGGAGIGNVFYAVSGRSGAGHTPRVDAFDVSTGQWTTKAPMPTSRAGFALAVARGRLFVFGGEGDPRSTTGVFPEVEGYDPAADAWATLPAMPTPRHGMGAASPDDRVVIVPGGGTKQGFGATDIVEAITP